MTESLIPLRIQWQLATAWCPPPLGFHLDGLIAWAMVKEAEEQGTFFENYDAVLDHLPFDKHQSPAGWVWKASFIRPTEVLGSERRYMTTKTAVAEMAERMNDGRIAGKALSSIDTVRGPFKNDAFWYTVEHAPACVAYCIGDPERITTLLDHVSHLGKRARLDHGRVSSFTVDEDPNAHRLWRNRYMPEPENGHQPVMGRLRPPYWMGEGQVQVWRPA